MPKTRSRLSKTEEFELFFKWICSDIGNFIKALGIKELTFQQQEVIDAIRAGHLKIAVKSGMGPGKTFLSTMIGLWRVIRNMNAKVIVTAPTMSQCKDVWLAQAKKHIENQQAHPFLKYIFNFTETGCGVFGNKQKMWGIMLKTAKNPDNIRGQHEKHMDIIVEEASGCPDEILELLEGTQSNKGGMYFMIGNPSRREGKFYNVFTKESQRKKFSRFTWNAEESPEWVVNPARNKEAEEKYGRDSDYYRVNILGDFPQSDPSSILSEEEIKACLDNMTMLKAASMEVDGRSPRQFGIDFARFGGDENIVMMRKGNAIIKWCFLSHVEPSKAAAVAFKWQSDMRWSNEDTVYVPDATGIGQGVLGPLYQADKSVHEFHNHNAPANPRKYADKITEAYFEVREKIRKKECFFPADELLIQQLTTRQYDIDRKGRLVIESKKEYKKRGYESPDRADAFVMAMYDNTVVRVQSS